MPPKSESRETNAPPVGAEVRLTVLGRIDLTSDGVPVDELLRRRKPFALFAYLALDDSGKYFQRDHLVDVFWPESTHRKGRASLRSALTVIRRALPGLLEFRGEEAMRIAPGRVSSDLGGCLRAVAAAAWTEAVALDGGELFEGFHLPRAERFEDWLDGLRGQLRGARAQLRASGAAHRPLTPLTPAARRPSPSPPPTGLSSAPGDPRGVGSTGAPAVAVGSKTFATVLAFCALLLILWAARPSGQRVPLPDASALAGYSDSPALPAYQAAMSLIGIEGLEGARHDRWERAEEHLSRAVTDDPDFAPGWAHLALVRFRRFWLGADPSRAGVEGGLSALNRAREVDPENPVTRLAGAYSAYHIERDWHGAADSASVLMDVLPSDPDVPLLWAMAERRRGNYAKSANIQQVRLAERPQELMIHGPELIQTLLRLGDTEGATSVLERMEEYDGVTRCGPRYNMLLEQVGPGEAVDNFATRCIAEQPWLAESSFAFWHEHWMRRPRAALDVVDVMVRARREAEVAAPGWVNQQWAPFPLDLLRARALYQLGDTAMAREVAAAHIPRLERLRDEFPDLSLRRRFLAISYAIAGRGDDALREARVARSIALEGGDLWAEVPGVDEDLLEIHALLGNDTEVVELLRALYRQDRPGLLPRLRADPLLDPIRDSEAFAAFLAEVAADQAPGRAEARD